MCKWFLWLVIISTCIGCTTVRRARTHEFGDGYFLQKKAGEPKKNVYLQVNDSALTVYSLQKDGYSPEAIPGQLIQLFPLPFDSVLASTRFIKRSLDVDLSTILFKYRFATGELPAQLNSNLNVALYLGYRADYFTLKEQHDPLKHRTRMVRHFEIDMGFFGGIGSTAINPSTTNTAVNLEYDGVIFQKGVAVFFGTHTFTLGIGIGTDNLVGKDKRKWVYREKPWLGVMIGLNITN
jgi:hypothetical protein